MYTLVAKEVTSCFIDMSLNMGALSMHGAICSALVMVFAHDAMGRRIDPSWGGPIELFLVSASAPRLVKQRHQQK